jgi:hypothetical protein
MKAIFIIYFKWNYIFSPHLLLFQTDKQMTIFENPKIFKILVATGGWRHSPVATVCVSSNGQMMSSEACYYCGSYLSSHLLPLNTNPRVFFCLEPLRCQNFALSPPPHRRRHPWTPTAPSRAAPPASVETHPHIDLLASPCPRPPTCPWWCWPCRHAPRKLQFCTKPPELVLNYVWAPV